MAEIAVREARAEEVDEVGALTERVYVEGGFAGGSYAKVLRDAASRRREAHLLVAVIDGRVVGTVTLAEPGTPFANDARPGELEVRMLATSEDARGRGVAAALMGAAEDRARALGMAAVVLSTDPGMDAAHRLYERRGYRRRPERDRSWEGVTLLAYGLEFG